MLIFTGFLPLFFVIGTLIMSQQLEFAKTKQPGFNKDGVLVINTHGVDGKKVAERFLSELAAYPEIMDMTATYESVGTGANNGYRFRVDDKIIEIQVASVEPNYLQFMDLKLAEGQDFVAGKSNFDTDVIVNRAMV